MLNLAFTAREDGDTRAWHIEDTEFVEAARKHLADWYAEHGKPDEVLRPSPAASRASS